MRVLAVLCGAQARNRAEREAFAAVVQGTAADFIKALLLRLHVALPALPSGQTPPSSGAAAAGHPAGLPGVRQREQQQQQASPAEEVCGSSSAAAAPRIAAVCRGEVVMEAQEGHVESVRQVRLFWHRTCMAVQVSWRAHAAVHICPLLTPVVYTGRPPAPVLRRPGKPGTRTRAGCGRSCMLGQHCTPWTASSLA